MAGLGRPRSAMVRHGGIPKTAAAESSEVLSESAEALAPTVEESMSNTMAAYVRGLGRTNR